MQEHKDKWICEAKKQISWRWWMLDRKEYEEYSSPKQRPNEIDEGSFQRSWCYYHSNHTHESWESIQCKSERVPQERLWYWTFSDPWYLWMSEEDSKRADDLVSRSKSCTDQRELLASCRGVTRSDSPLYICSTSWWSQWTSKISYWSPEWLEILQRISERFLLLNRRIAPVHQWCIEVYFLIFVIWNRKQSSHCETQYIYRSNQTVYTNDQSELLFLMLEIKYLLILDFEMSTQ